MQKTKIGLRGLNAKQKVEKAKKIQKSLEATDRFGQSRALKLHLVGLAASRKALEKAIGLSEYGDKRALGVRNLCERDLDEKIRRLATCVEAESGGEEAFILKAGFELRKRNNRPEPMPAPKSPALKRTDTGGEIILRWKPVPNSKNYHIELSLAGKVPKTWQTTHYTTKSRCLIDGLKPGTKYTVRVRAMGAHGVGPPSKPLEFYAA